MVTDGRKLYTQKWRKAKDGTIIAFVGDYNHGIQGLRLMADGQAIPSHLFSKDTDFFRFDPRTGRAWGYEKSNHPQELKRSNAFGSGDDLALGAMAMGADAKQAAAVACRISDACGGKVWSFSKES